LMANVLAEISNVHVFEVKRFSRTVCNENI